MMKQQSNKLKMYDAPRIKVVSFTIEQGFAPSTWKAEPQINTYDKGTEDVIEGSGLQGYFPRNNN